MVCGFFIGGTKGVRIGLIIGGITGRRLGIFGIGGCCIRGIVLIVLGGCIIKFGWIIVGYGEGYRRIFVLK